VAGQAIGPVIDRMSIEASGSTLHREAPTRSGRQASSDEPRVARLWCQAGWGRTRRGLESAVGVPSRIARAASITMSGMSDGPHCSTAWRREPPRFSQP